MEEVPYRFSVQEALGICAEGDSGQTWLTAIQMTQVVLWAFTLRHRQNQWRPSQRYGHDAGLLAVTEYFEALGRRKTKPDHVLVASPDVPEAELVLGLFVQFGGFRRLSDGLRWRAFRSRIKKHRSAADAVYLMVNFLVRAKIHGCEKPPVFEDAYEFVSRSSKNEPLLAEFGIHLKGVKRRTVIKFWDQFRASSPIIYAARRQLPCISEPTTMEELLINVHQICGSESARKRFVGEVAFAADVVSNTAKHFNAKRYKGLSSVVPETRPFNGTEQDIIRSIDRFGPIS